MRHSCPNCAAALVFDPDDNKLICKNCDSTFAAEDFKMKENIDGKVINDKEIGRISCKSGIVVVLEIDNGFKILEAVDIGEELF